MLRWTFVFTLLSILYSFIHSHYSRSKSFYLICCRDQVTPFALGIQFFHPPLLFGWGCKSNALFSISKLRRNFFFFPSRLLESAPLLAFPPYLCPSLFSQSGCKSMRLPNTIQIYAEVFFYQIAYRCNSSLVFNPMGREKKLF